MAEEIQEMELRERLLHRLSVHEVREFVSRFTKDGANDADKETLYALTFDADQRVSVNAFWIFTHFDDSDNEWLFRYQNDLINRVLKEENVAKRRLMLSLLLRQPFEEANFRVDFMDHCLSQITACTQPYAIRACCIKLAYEQMRSYAELLTELQTILASLTQTPLSPGLASAKRQIEKKIKIQLKRLG